MRVVLENCDIDSDIQAFIQVAKTGQDHPGNTVNNLAPFFPVLFLAATQICPAHQFPENKQKIP